MSTTASLPRWLRRAFIAGALTWVLALPLATFAASRPAEGAAVHLAAVIPYAVGAVVCHQQAVRSFHLWSRQLPVCARCTGLYVGAALIALLASFRTKVKTVAQPPSPRFGEPRRSSPETRASGGGGLSPAEVLVLAALPTAATLAYEWSTGAPPSNALRALSGVPLGAAVASVVLAAASDRVN